MINTQWDSILMVGFDICDWNRNVVLRSLKVDFTGSRVLMGETDSNLFGTNFDSVSPGIIEINQAGASPADLAQAAAKWLSDEMSRPIILNEWITWSSHHTEYKTLDHDQVPEWVDSQNKKCWLSRWQMRAASVHPKNARKTLITRY